MYKSYKKYCKTGNEEYFNQCYDEIKNLIRHKIKIYGLYDEIEDITQEVFINLWKSTSNYDQGRPAGPFIRAIITKGVQSQLTKKNTGKRKLNDDAGSLDKERSSRESDGRATLYNKIRSKAEVEQEYFVKENIKIVLQKLNMKLTKMEKKVFEANIITDDLETEQSNLQKIIELTGCNHKQVDNALQRIRKKVKSIFKKMEDDQLC